ncbi:hypothetical protein B296_00026731 [Ensete ventricosum]|uniref:Uncharacterized protein n=1 Tax=Ensete ventricosum TaxID=4639 RepID=A0A427AH55_ENSVE|nr:hypothetical protein B296_00026731 [Ensete ventricosum]
MKVENMVKLKEEFDYKSLCRRLDIELDKLLAENERQRKDFEDEIERIRTEADSRVAEVEKGYSNTLEAPTRSSSADIVEVRQLLQNEKLLRQSTEEVVMNLKCEISRWKRLEVMAAGNSEIVKLRKMLDSEANQKYKLEEEIAILRSQLLQLSFQAEEVGGYKLICVPSFK